MVLGLCLPVLLTGPLLAAGCRNNSVDLRGPWGSARFSVELAVNDAERARGLMYREEMAASAGMLFAYARPQRRISFWMRNTLIPLDILFFDADGVLRTIQADARPLDETPLPGGDDIQYVLEINGGLAARLGIEPGSEMRHPLIDGPGAAWPC